PVPCADEHFAIAVGHLRVDHRVALFDAHRDDPARARIAERAQLRLLDDPPPRAHDDELVLFELLDGQQRGDAFALLHRHQVGDRLAAAVWADIGNLVHLEPVGAAAIREDHDVGVGRRDEEMADEILFARAHADPALAAAPLVPVVRDRSPLDVAGVADRDRHVFLGNQVLDPEFAFLRQDLRAPIIPVPVPHRPQLVDDDLHQQLFARQDRQQPFDQFEQLGQFIEDLLALQAGQPLELHVEDGLRLNLAQAELRHQTFPRLGGVFRRPDQRDHRIEMIDGDLQAFEDVAARFGLSQLEFGPPADDLAPELDEVVDQLDEREHLRAAADNGEHDDAEAALQRRVLVEIVEDDVADFAALQVDDDPHPVAIRLVADVGDPFNRLLAYQLRDSFDQARLVDLIRNRVDD